MVMPAQTRPRAATAGTKSKSDSASTSEHNPKSTPKTNGNQKKSLK